MARLLWCERCAEVVRTGDVCCQEQRLLPLVRGPRNTILYKLQKRYAVEDARWREWGDRRTETAKAIQEMTGVAEVLQMTRTDG